MIPKAVHQVYGIALEPDQIKIDTPPNKEMGDFAAADFYWPRIKIPDFEHFSGHLKNDARFENFAPGGILLFIKNFPSPGSFRLAPCPAF